MITFKQAANLDALADWKRAYLQTLTAPLDGCWQAAITDLAPHYLILVNGRPAGYFAADDQKRVSVHTYLFHDARPVEPVLPAFPNAQFRLAVPADLDELTAFYGRNNEYEDTAAIEANFGDRRAYAQDLIVQEQVFLLVDGRTLLGIGERRISASQPPYADIGMITDRAYWRRGIGAYTLAQLKSGCYRQNLRPICSCAAGNLVSRKTIEKAGFVTNHRILDVQF